MKKKLLSLLLALAILFSAMPTFTAFSLDDAGTVTVTVANSTAFTQTEGAQWSGALIDQKPVSISPGDTVLDVLEKALTDEINGVADYTSTGISTGYVTEINGLKAGDATALGKNAPNCAYWDGWCYAVNNIVPGVGMGSVYVKNGDKVRIEYSLDGTVSGASWGSCDNADSGFTFSSGVFSYVKGKYSIAYTLTLPAVASIQVTAVPGAEGKAVRIYHNGMITGGLNSDISLSNGSKLQIVVGDYENVYQIAVRTADTIDSAALRAGIAASLADNTSSYWNIVGMMANNGSFLYSDTEKQAYLNTAINSFVSPTDYSATAMAMHIIAMTALGYDVTQMIDHGNPYQAFDILKAQVAADTKGGEWAEIYAYSLMAYLQADPLVRSQYDAEINSAIAKLAGKPTGDWFGSASPDSAGITLAALCMAESKGYPVDSTAKASAVAYLKGAVEQDGTIQGGYPINPNANSTAMAILGLDAAGEDVSTITANGSNISLRYGLLLYALGDDSGFTNTGGEVNTLATQQGFLALAAADRSGASQVLDFSGKGKAIPETSTAYTGCPVLFSIVPNSAVISVTKSGDETPVSALVPGRYDLPEGSYTYTVSKSGYLTKTGLITVTPEDAESHTRKALSVSLSSKPSDSNTITVNLYVKTPADSTGTYTYKNNSSTYKTSVSKTLTLKTGSTVFDALDAALTAAGKTYTETDYGYIAAIDGLSEFDQGSKSGWLYRVGKTTPEINCRDYKLTEDETVIWFYTNDYTSEYGSEKWSSHDAKPSSEISLSAPVNKNGEVSTTLSGDDLTAFNKAIAAESKTEGTEASLKVSIPEEANSLILTLPQSTVNALRNTSTLSLRVENDFANLTFDPKSLAEITNSASDKNIAISILKADRSKLNKTIKELVGDRPVYSFSIQAGNTQISEFGQGRVSVSIPYTPLANEDRNAIVAYYLDPSGTLQAMRGKYNEKSRAVDFTVSHFSEYGVGYHKVIFSDAADSAWYRDAVTFCAARDITSGIGNSMFAPEHSLTRGQFIVMLMRAYGLKPDENPKDNFADAGNAYYTNYLAAAKRIGLSTGIGGNQFAPDSKISRQDMFTMLYRALHSLGEVPVKACDKNLSGFTDSEKIADYAKPALETLIAGGIITGSDGKLSPEGSTTRAQIVQVFYKLMSK